jgi:hypothetical protein
LSQKVHRGWIGRSIQRLQRARSGLVLLGGSSGVLRVFIACAACGVFSSCSLNDLSRNRDYICESLRRPLTVAAARGTFLLKSSRLFYPNGIPGDPSLLPDLMPPELAEIERMLASVLSHVHTTQTRHATLLLRHFPGADLRRAAVELQPILNQGVAVAGTESSGRMFFDAKVVQAIYRSALLAVLVEDERDTPAGERESIAFRKFAEFSKKLDAMSPIMPLSTAAGFAEGVKQTQGKNPSDVIFAGLAGSVESYLSDTQVLLQSHELEQKFLGASEFMLAHENAHLVLGHFPASTECDEARGRELTADSYAVLLNTLANFDGITEGSGLPKQCGGSLLAFMAALRDSGADYYHSFFTYAYDLAGFDRAMASLPGCDYPPTSEREERAELFASIVSRTLDDARSAEARRRTGDKSLLEALGASPFDASYESMVKFYSQYYSKTPGVRTTLVQYRDLLEALFYTYYHRS